MKANMAKMVEIEKLLEAVRMLSTTFYSYHTLTRILDELPIIDTVEVVRCKDCIYQAECAFTEWLGRNGNGFCSQGELKENG